LRSKTYRGTREKIVRPSGGTQGERNHFTVFSEKYAENKFTPRSNKVSFWVYILQCSDGSYYVGHTDNLEKRLGEHRTGEIEGYSSSRLPVSLVFAEDFPSRIDALERERQVKRWSRKKKEALIARDWDKLVEVSKKDFSKK